MMVLFFFSKQKTAYERRISDWSSDVCSSDLSSCSTSAAAMPTGMHTLPSMQAEQFGASGGKGTRFCMIYLDAAQALYASQRLATNNDESLLYSLADRGWRGRFPRSGRLCGSSAGAMGLC